MTPEEKCQSALAECTVALKQIIENPKHAKIFALTAMHATGVIAKEGRMPEAEESTKWLEENGHRSAQEAAEARTVGAVSGVNQRGEGFVHIVMEHGEEQRSVLQATPVEAREISRHIAEAAEAADSDAFLMQFLTRKLALEENKAAAVMIEFREWRELSGGVASRKANDPHWQHMANKIKENKDRSR